MSETIFGPKLYKRDVSGNIRIWFTERKGAHWRIHSGINGGTITQTGWTTCEPKNVGRSNATTPEEQARVEVQAEYTKKVDRGYFERIEDVDKPVFFKPMLAHPFEERKAKVDIRRGVHVQPKLDGIRCIIRADGAWTRQGKPITSIPHILASLKKVFNDYPDAIFDGELYNHDLRDNFNEIASIVRKQKPSAADLRLAEERIQYHVYDMPSVYGDFEYRYEVMIATLEDYGTSEALIPDVYTIYARTWEDVDEVYGKFLNEGYEGQIIRLPGLYENKRSGLLLKRKEFIDDEFEIIRIEEGNGNWAGYAKRIVFKLPDGREVGAGLKGSQEFAKDLLSNADRYVGGQATIRYFTPTPDGIPRFPVATVLFEGKRDI